MIRTGGIKMQRNRRITFIIFLIMMFVFSGCINQRLHHQVSEHHDQVAPNNEHHMMRGHGRHMMGHGPMNRYSTYEDSTGENELNVPPILESDRETKNDIYYTIEAMQGETEIIPGTSTQTLGYNGDFLGPIIQLREGQNAHFTLKNSLNEETTFHWHGLVVDGLADGGPHDPLLPGDERNLSFPVQQSQATLWFHPHPLGKTAKQVYEGLAGLIYIEDDNENPFTHGVNDFPLIFQDRVFTEKGQLDYNYAYHPDGVVGNTLLINGTVNPRLTVPKEQVRLRLLNGSNKVNHTFRLSNGQSFSQIASDGGLLKEPIDRSEITLSPAERAEIIVDFSKVTDDESINLIARDGTVLLPFVIEQKESNFSVPIDLFLNETLNKDKTIDDNIDKKIVLSGHGHHVAINGKKFSEERIDFTQKLGETNIWEVYNEPDPMGGSDHPFHIHGTQFEIISLNGEKPPVHLQGLKDTVPLVPGDRAKLAVRFNEPGVFMFHCHILEHEDNGMMGQVLVE